MAEPEQLHVIAKVEISSQGGALITAEDPGRDLEIIIQALERLVAWLESHTENDFVQRSKKGTVQ